MALPRRCGPPTSPRRIAWCATSMPASCTSTPMAAPTSPCRSAASSSPASVATSRCMRWTNTPISKQPGFLSVDRFSLSVAEDEIGTAVGDHDHRRVRVTTDEPGHDRAARLRPEHTRIDLHAVPLDRTVLGALDHHRQHVELDVGTAVAIGVEEAAALDHIRGEQAGAEHEVLQAVPQGPQATVLAK